MLIADAGKETRIPVAPIDEYVSKYFAIIKASK